MTRDELELLTLAECAQLWHVSKRTVQRWAAAGVIPTVTIGGQQRVRVVDAARIADFGTAGYREHTSTERSSR